MELVQQWRQALVTRGVMKIQITPEEQRELIRKEAAAIIALIPALMEVAREKCEFSIAVFRNVSDDEIAENLDETVEEMFERRGVRFLKADMLTGRARIVFDWCDENNLHCFFTKVKPNFDAFFHFNVCPK